MSPTAFLQIKVPIHPVLGEVVERIAHEGCRPAHSDDFNKYLVKSRSGGLNMGEHLMLWSFLHKNKTTYRIAHLPSTTEIEKYFTTEAGRVLEDEKAGRRIRRESAGVVSFEKNYLKIVLEQSYRDYGKVQDFVRCIPGITYAKGAWYTATLTYIKKIREVVPELTLDDSARQFLVELLHNEQKKQVVKSVEEARKSLEFQQMLKSCEIEKGFIGPKGNHCKAKEYQVYGITFMLSRKTQRHGKDFYGTILADDVGLGKTIQSLYVAKAIQQKYKARIICVVPVNVIYKWPREAKALGVNIEVTTWHGESIMTPPDEPYFLIADEAVRAKNEKAKRTRALLKLSGGKNCLGCIVITGTPSKNGDTDELFPLLKLVNHPLGANKQEFKKRFSAVAAYEELGRILSDVILCRTKEDVLPELPPLKREILELQPNLVQRLVYDNLYKKLQDDFIERIKNGLVCDKAYKLVTLGHLRKAASLAKVSAAVDMAAGLMEAGESVLMFTHYEETAHQIAAQLDAFLITGKVNAQKRQAIVDKFQASHEPECAVITTGAGSEAITLTKASRVILVDRGWSPADYIQAEGRAHRLGNENGVIASWVEMFPICKKTDQIVLSKQSKIDLLMKAPKDSSRSLIEKMSKVEADIVDQIFSELFPPPSSASEQQLKLSLESIAS